MSPFRSHIGAKLLSLLGLHDLYVMTILGDLNTAAVLVTCPLCFPIYGEDTSTLYSQEPGVVII